MLQKEVLTSVKLIDIQSWSWKVRVPQLPHETKRRYSIKSSLKESKHRISIDYGAFLCIFVSKWRPSSIGWQSYLGQFLLQIILLTYFQFQNWNRCSLQSYSRWQRKSRCSLHGIRSGRFTVLVSHFLSETNLLAKKFFDCDPKFANN